MHILASLITYYLKCSPIEDRLGRRIAFYNERWALDLKKENMFRT